MIKKTSLAISITLSVLASAQTAEKENLIPLQIANKAWSQRTSIALEVTYEGDAVEFLDWDVEPITRQTPSRTQALFLRPGIISYFSFLIKSESDFQHQFNGNLDRINFSLEKRPLQAITLKIDKDSFTANFSYFSLGTPTSSPNFPASLIFSVPISTKVGNGHK